MRGDDIRAFPLEKLADGYIKPGNVIFLGNFDSEKYWYQENMFQIPYITDHSKQRLFRYCDELFIYLATKKDVVVLRRSLDDEFLQYLTKAGIGLPYFEVVSQDQEQYTLTQLILQDQAMMDRLIKRVEKAKLKKQDVYLLPYCVTADEVELASKIGALVVPDNAEICAYINDKAQARHLAEKLAFSVPKGKLCRNISELKVTYKDFNNRQVVVKELFGVGGGGLVVIDHEDKFNQFCQLIEKNTADAQADILIEKWYEVVFSLNCQYMISDKIYAYGCSRQILEEGSFVGSQIPAEASVPLRDVSRHMEATLQLCELIQEIGYRGVVGIDTIATKEGEFYAIDINARFNISTFFYGARSLLGNPSVVIGRWFEFKYITPLNFNQLVDILGEETYSRRTRRGYFILNFHSMYINSLYDGKGLKYGKVYVLIAGKDLTDTTAQQKNLCDRIAFYNRRIVTEFN